MIFGGEPVERLQIRGEISRRYIAFNLIGIAQYHERLRYFSFPNKKSNQKKSPCYAALRAPLRFSKRAGLSATRFAQTALRLCRPLLRCSARHKGGKAKSFRLSILLENLTIFSILWVTHQYILVCRRMRFRPVQAYFYS